MPAFFVSADEGRIYGVCRKCALFVSGERLGNVISEKKIPAGNAAGGVPVQDVEYTADDLKTALEESERSLHEAVFIARKVWSHWEMSGIVGCMTLKGRATSTP